MKINDKYEITVVVAEELENGNYGDIYDNFEEFKKEKPNSTYFFGYCIIDRRTGFIPDEPDDVDDLFETVEDAMDYYRKYLH